MSLSHCCHGEEISPTEAQSRVVAAPWKLTRIQQNWTPLSPLSGSTRDQESRDHDLDSKLTETTVCGVYMAGTGLHFWLQTSIFVDRWRRRFATISATKHSIGQTQFTFKNAGLTFSRVWWQNHLGHLWTISTALSDPTGSAYGTQFKH